MTDERARLGEFSLLGGPLHRLGCRLGLVRDGTNTIRLGLVLGGVAWAVLALLAFIEGIAPRVFSLSVIAGHVRLLLVVPLFFLCESWLDPRVTTFAGTLVRSGVVPSKALPALDREIARTIRRKDSWFVEAMCLLAAVLMSVSASYLHLSGTTGVFDPSRGVAGTTMTGLWYFGVCLTLVRFLMFRWLWRLGLWSYFLWRLARLDLQLVPTHPDGAAGLGYLEVVHMHFTPLVLALSAIQSASLAEELSTGAVTFEAIYPVVALLIIVVAALFVGPLFIFTPRLWACKVKGLSEYMEFAERYVRGFDTKWLGTGAAPEEPLLGTADLQSLADLNNSLSVVRTMRWVPATPQLLVTLAAPVLVALLPLLLLKYPITELAQKFIERISGL